MIYSITAQSLTPIGDLSKLNATCGVFHQLVRAASERSAIETAMETIAGYYTDSNEGKAICNYDVHTVTVMDESAHIINHYWGFKGHEV
jgi:hypothetical protein